VGVLKDPALYEDTFKGIRAGVPLCSHHRDELRNSLNVDWDEVDFQRFID